VPFDPRPSAIPTLAMLTLLLAAAPARAWQDGYQPAQPDQKAREAGLILRMNFDFGGTRLAEVKWSDGSTATLRAGQLATFSAGVFYHPAAPWTLEGTVGYKFDKVNGSNGSLAFTRFPIDVIASWATGGHRLGAGPTAHLAPKATCDLSGTGPGTCNSSLSYDAALGGIVQYAYGFKLKGDHGVDLGVRYTYVKYRGSGLLTLDGSGFGFFLGGWL
jgi:hypothetical protein